MSLKYGRAQVANRVSIGDTHDLSIEWFITYTDYPIYVIERVGERFRIVGANKQEEVKHGDAEKETGQTGEEKKLVAGKSGKSKPKTTGGKRGKSGKSGNKKV